MISNSVRGFMLLVFILGMNTVSFSQNNYQEVIKNADVHLGGMIPGITWDLNVDNYEKGEVKNNLKLLVEASTVNSQKFALITFQEPVKFEGQKLLLRDNNMWFMKRGLNQPLPISGRQRLTGSAANADVASSNYSIDYTISGTTEEKLNNEECYVFLLEAKNNLISYARVKYWVTKKTNLAMKSEYYSKSGDKLIKTAFYEYANDFTYKSERTKFVSKISIMDNVTESNKTILNISTLRFPNFNNSKFEKDNLN